MFLCEYVHVHIEAGCQSQMSFLKNRSFFPFPSLLFPSLSFLSLPFPFLSSFPSFNRVSRWPQAHQVGQQVPGVHLSSPPQDWDYTCTTEYFTLSSKINLRSLCEHIANCPISLAVLSSPLFSSSLFFSSSSFSHQGLSM